MSTDASRFSRAAYLDSSRLIDTFERDVDDVARTVAANVLTSMQAFPTYGQSDMERQVFEQVREHARLILNMTRTGCPPGPEQLEFARRAGALRTGVAPLAAVIHGYRVGCWSFCDWIGNAAGSDPEDLRAALSLTASCMEHDRIASGAIAAGYLRQRESQTGDPAEMLTNRASPRLPWLADLRGFLRASASSSTWWRGGSQTGRSGCGCGSHYRRRRST